MIAPISRIAGTPSTRRSVSGRCSRPAAMEDSPARAAAARRRAPCRDVPGTVACRMRQPIPSAMPAPSRCGATRPRISWTPSRPSARCRSGAGHRCCRAREWHTRASPARCRRVAGQSPTTARRSARVRSYESPGRERRVERHRVGGVARARSRRPRTAPRSADPPGPARASLRARTVTCSPPFRATCVAVRWRWQSNPQKASSWPGRACDGRAAGGPASSRPAYTATVQRPAARRDGAAAGCRAAPRRQRPAARR